MSSIFSKAVVILSLIISTMDCTYMGDKFPKTYLGSEIAIPTTKDLDKFINGLQKTVDYFAQAPNKTDCNKALGLFFVKVILKKTLEHYALRDKVHYDILMDMIKKADVIVSHYIYKVKILIGDTHNWDYPSELKISQIFKDDTPFLHSIENFRKDRLRYIILATSNINDYTQAMDEATLPKEKYIELMNDQDYYINVDDSDLCMSRVMYNPEPLDLTVLRPCISDPYCRKCIRSSPSIAYSLSHRLANLLMYRYSRRCYFESPDEDALQLELLCAYMYRETVYIARRGYFFRDMFLEHIALCTILGYEEFYRRHWFYKALSWLDDRGCMVEDRNFLINSSANYLSRTNEEQKAEAIRRRRNKRLAIKCENHAMALLVIVLANAVRHTMHFMKEKR